MKRNWTYVDMGQKEGKTDYKRAMKDEKGSKFVNIKGLKEGIKEA